MTISIRKMLSGGGLPPFTHYQPVMVNNSSPASASATASVPSSTTTKATGSSSSSGLITDKDLLTLVSLIDGLPSDMKAVISSILDMYAFPTMGDSLGAGDLSNRYLSAIYSVKTAAFNKKEFDKAYNEVDKKNGLPEIAITSLGKIVAVDKDKNIYQLTIDLLQASGGKYTPITNSQLLDLRANNKALDNSLLDVVSNGISMDTVNKYIQGLSSKLGTSTSSIDGYSRTIDGKVLEGLSIIQNMLGSVSLDGIYKSTQLSSSLKTQAELAVSYILSTMPENMKTLLKLKSDGTEKGAANLVCLLINSGMDSTNKFTTLMVLDAEGNSLGGKKGSGSGSGSSSGRELSAAELFLSLNGQEVQIELNPGTTYSYHGTGYNGQITTKEGTSLGANNTLLDVSNSSFSSILDMGLATMGGNRLNSTAFNKLLLRDGSVTRVDLPIDMEEYLKTGIIKPNFKVLAALDKAEADIKAGNITDPNLINAILQKYQIPSSFKWDGKLFKDDTSTYRSFAILHAVGDATVFKDGGNFDENTLLQITDEGEVLNYTEQIQKLTGNDKYKAPTSGALWWSENEIYSGTVFIPIKTEAWMEAAATGGNGFKSSVTDIGTEQLVIELWEAARNAKQQTNYLKPPSLNEIS